MVLMKVAFEISFVSFNRNYIILFMFLIFYVFLISLRIWNKIFHVEIEAEQIYLTWLRN